MKIHNLLTDPRVVSLRPEQTVLEATQRMVEDRCGSVVVTDANDHLRGIFTERDLMVRVVSKTLDPSTTRLEDVMTTELYTTTAERRVAEVRREMRDMHIRHVPVVAGDSILGVLSMRDLLRADFEEKRDDAKAMTAYIRGDLLNEIREQSGS